MDKLWTNGLRLFIMTISYIVLSLLYLRIFYWNSSFSLLGIIIGIFFLVMFFVYGYRIHQGFRSGLFIGVIGSSLGILLSLISIILLIINNGTSLGLILMSVWMYPFTSLFDELPYLGKLDIFLPHISVIFSIILTALGSWSGHKLSKNQNKKEALAK